jgi:hypothetical protein
MPRIEEKNNFFCSLFVLVRKSFQIFELSQPFETQKKKLLSENIFIFTDHKALSMKAQHK